VFRRNWGPRCLTPTLEKDAACTAAPGADKQMVDVYPEGLQKDDGFCKKLEKEKNAKDLLAPFTVVREKDKKLVAVPYTEAYASEMKAIAAKYQVPDAGVRAIAAGCDGLLICSGDQQVQAATLEAVIRAVEEGRIRRAAIDDALTRHRRAKERFLTASVTRPEGRRGLRAIVGREEHQAIAHEMARFV